jgi:pyruvate kinase
MNIEALTEALNAIYDKIRLRDPANRALLESVHPDFRLSAENLLHYLVLRNEDLRDLHDPLSDLGISSLRTAEGYVQDNLHQVLRLLYMMQGRPWAEGSSPLGPGYAMSKSLIRNHSKRLFNRSPEYQEHEIMVTMPESAAFDGELIEKMAASGMTIARINLSHGELDIWTRLVEQIRAASEATGKDLRIYMDLPGPKIRIEFPSGITALPVQKGMHFELRKGPVGPVEFERAVRNPVPQTPIPVTLSIPEVVSMLKVGEKVFFDDGMIRGVVRETGAHTARIRILKSFKEKLKPDKGMNLPETLLNLPSLTPQDREHLPFVVAHADLLGYSFVKNESDVSQLYELLQACGDKKPGVVFKIENLNAFNRLPLILLEGMKYDRIGVMIARGDLAVELGFDRISEVQNEILWLCEAAHVPVIWATQVLDNLAKRGIATRAEISDAALSIRSECVMLNKGRYILDAISELRTILHRMESHSSKNKNALRPLQIAKINLERLDRSGRYGSREEVPGVESGQHGFSGN